jgi:NAD(P)-dependent dehydrogenase (short-subunit alcohol dehydrogenase family)
MDRKETIKTCLITGSNSGIGKATAIEMAQRGYNILMLCRDSEKSRNAQAEIKAGSNEIKVDLVYVDFSSLKSVEHAASEITQKYDSIDVLINNAGVVKRKLSISEDGLEMNLAVNFLAPFYLTNLLLPLLKQSDSARIINVTSELYKNGKIDMDNDYSRTKYQGNRVYANAKLWVVLFTYQLAEILADEKITVNCVHPGVIQTDAFRDYPVWYNKMLGIFLSEPEEGAKPLVYLATSDEVNEFSGKYYSKSKLRETTKNTQDREQWKLVWNRACELTGLKNQIQNSENRQTL